MDRAGFYIDDHAALIGFLAKSADELAREDGLEAVIKGIISYGRERGLRGAKRCLADGNELTGNNYILYGEWSDPQGWSKQETLAASPHLVTRMKNCAWCDIWEKYGLMKYGALYCDWIDKNLVAGFNPELTLELDDILSHGGPGCKFDWQSTSFADDNELDNFNRLRARMIPKVTRDFLYHCGHVLSTFSRHLLLELGLIRGTEVIDAGMAEYAKTFGQNKADAIIEESKIDFMEV